MVQARLDDYTEEVFKKLMAKTGDKKSEVVRKGILLYAERILGLDELMKIRIAQDFGKEVDFKEVD